MADAIITRDTIRARARAAFEAGLPRDEHGMNWHADALPTWLEEFDRCAYVAKADLELCGINSQQSHAAPAGRRQFDLRQGEAA